MSLERKSEGVMDDYKAILTDVLINLVAYNIPVGRGEVDHSAVVYVVH